VFSKEDVYVSIDRCGLLLMLLVPQVDSFNGLTSPCSHPFQTVFIPRTDGSWLGFGSSRYGELSLGDLTDQSTPTALTTLGTSDVESCVLGGYHTICKK
jgi:hypothetical protein